MKIYYTCNYESSKGESHRLLKNVIEISLQSEGHESPASEATELLDSMYKGTEYGKPVIDEFYEFSISHSGSYWAVAVGDCQCGLDVQCIKSNTNYELVTRKMFSEREAAAVSEKGPDEFFRLWARREAMVKAAGTTVVNYSLPPVLDDEVVFEDKVWCIMDVELPDAEGVKSAVCWVKPENEEEVSIEYNRIG